MTNEEAYKKLSAFPMKYDLYTEDLEAVSRALIALQENERMQKEEVKNTIKRWNAYSISPKKGKWEPIEYDGYADGAPVWDVWECSECGFEHKGDEDTLTRFCPDCGAKMEDEE